MENRKLIAFGTNSFVISLPKPWINSHKLGKGDIININEQDKELVISISSDNNKSLQRVVKINVDKDISLLRTEIFTAYLKGYDEIDMKGNTLKDKISEIRKILLKLSGLEVMHLTSDEMKVKNLLNEKSVSINELIQRAHSMVKSMITDTSTCFEKDLSESIVERDRDVNRMVFLSTRVAKKCLEDRVFARELNLFPPEILTIWQINFRLEKIGDQVKRISRFLKDLDIDTKGKKKLKEIFTILEKDYNVVMGCYFNPNHPKPFDIATTSKQNIKDMCSKIIEKYHSISIWEIVENYKNVAISIEHIAQTILARE